MLSSFLISYVVATPFWGEPTSTIDWCEPNYKLTRFVAEPLNTISNLSFVLLGLFGAIHGFREQAKRSYIAMYIMLTAIGLGSMAFHGTLTYLGQQLDELPMVWLLLAAFFVVNNDAIGSAQHKKHVGAALVTWAALFSAGHIHYKTTTTFQVHFALLLAAVLARVYHRFRDTNIGSQGRQIIGLYVSTGLLAFTCWLVDYHGCQWIGQYWPIPKWVPGGHVWWHIFMGYSAYCGLVMLHVLEAGEKLKPIKIDYHFGIPSVRKDTEALKNSHSEIF
jgi:dihydroceramidase